MAKCSVCGTELEEGQKFCFECGAPIPQTKKCIYCGTELPLKMKFCPECGTKQDGTANASGSGFSMGDKNVIAGDVIGHKEDTHIAGNATIIKNEDETKKTAKCHICGSIVKIVDGFDCPECGQFTCENCYDEKYGCCTECAEKHGEQKINRYKEALKMVLADGRIDFSERKELISLQQELGISAEKAKLLEEELKKAALGTGSEITTFEKVSLDKATNLFYKDGNVKEALKILEPVYKAHKNDEKVLDVYLPVLAEVAPLEALDVINGLQIDILTAFVVSIGIYIKQKNLVEAEKRLNQALRIWHESSLLKCYNVLFNYAMYKQFEDFSFMEKACNLAEQLGEAQNELELSYQVKVQAMLQAEVGEAVTEFDEEFCEQNHLYWFVMQADLLSNIDKNNVTVGKDEKADFKTIQEALNYVNENATIIVLPGLYDEHLIFKKSVHLVGCKEDIKNKSSKELPVVVLDSSKSCEINIPVEIEGIVFTHEKNLNFNKLNDFINQTIEFKDDVYEDCDYDSENFKSLLWIKSNSHLKNIAVLCAEWYAVTFSKEKTVLENSVIFHSNEVCLYIREDACPKISNCKISNSRCTGLVVLDDANPDFRQCEIYSHLFDGICISDDASGTYNDCDIHDNNSTGLEVHVNANPTVENCVIHGNSENGIYISGDATGIYQNCTIYDNKTEGENYPGVVACNNANPDFRQCEIYNHLSDGIWIKDNATGIYNDCDIHDNELRGLGVQDNANPMVVNCDIHENSGNGILISGYATGIYQYCTIYDNKTEGENYPGVVVKENANPDFRQCEIYSHLSNGIWIKDDASGTYTDCYIHDNKGTAVDSSKTSKSIDTSTCRKKNNG